MDRKAEILKGIERKQLGIEVAPWGAPMAPKREGYNVKILDVFDKKTLLERARADANIPPDQYEAIEEVDFVGGAPEIAEIIPAELHGTFDYIICSHVLEHMPDPIKFLQGCQVILRPGGLLSMAVPDARACFDYFRPHTTVGEWLEAHIQKRQRPVYRQVFDLHAYSAAARIGDQNAIAFNLGHDQEKIVVTGDLSASYQAWLAENGSGKYNDTHCTVVTPASLELLITECRYLGLLNMRIESISETNGYEFYVRIRNEAPSDERISKSNINATRAELLRRMWRERASVIHRNYPSTIWQDIAALARRAARGLGF